MGVLLENIVKCILGNTWRSGGQPEFVAKFSSHAGQLQRGTAEGFMPSTGLLNAMTLSHQ